MAKNNRKAPAGAVAAQPSTPAPAAPQIVLVSFAVFSFKNGNMIKAPVDNADIGKAILKDVLVSLSTGKPYINEEKGIVFNPTELSHAFLAVEQVQR